MKQQGWWTNQLWTLLDVPLRYGLYDIWPDLDRDHKIELMSRARSEDTMKAWETHLQMKDAQ